MIGVNFPFIDHLNISNLKINTNNTYNCIGKCYKLQN